MKKKSFLIMKKYVMLTAIILIIVFVTLTFLLKIQYQQHQAQLKMDQSDIKFLSDLINKSLDLDDASTENPYFDAMKNADNIYDTFSQWTGIEKKQKQQAYFSQEDVQKVVAECSKENCRYADQLKELQRAVDTRIKSLEDQNVQESNQLSALSSQLLWKNFWSIMEDPSIYKLKILGEDKINAIVDRFYDAAVIDYTDRKNWCSSLSSDYYSFARYKNSCNLDFKESIKNISSVDLSEKDLNDQDISSMFSACTIERKLKAIQESAPTLCPHVAQRNSQLAKKADAYLSAQK
jgi:hypothetical protein